MAQEKCFLCTTEAKILTSDDNTDNRIVKCSICGDYIISKDAIVAMHPNQPNKHILSGLSRRSNIKETKLFISSENFEELINSTPVPSDPIEMINLILLYMYQNAKSLAQPIELLPSDYPIVYAKNAEDFTYLLNRAIELELIKSISRNNYRLEIDGWRKVLELKQRNPDSNYVFIAMWFNDKTLKLRDVIKNAVLTAGYEPIIADEYDYTGNIMDFVLSSIKQCKFVIADFTCIPEQIIDKSVKGGVRGGVYYEAGYAKGIGLQVIHLCKNDEESKLRLHFDIAQDNTLFWEDEDVEINKIRDMRERQSENKVYLSERLHDRILVIFGKGSLTQSEIRTKLKEIGCGRNAP